MKVVCSPYTAMDYCAKHLQISSPVLKQFSQVLNSSVTASRRLYARNGQKKLVVVVR